MNQMLRLSSKNQNPMRPVPMRRTRAFTLVELLVVIAIIGVLIGMAVPAMQNMRELSRRSNCQQNLMQISLALSTYATRHSHYPIGSVDDQGPIKSEPKGFHHNWITGMLPMLDAQTVYDAIDRNVSVYDQINEPARSLRIPVLRCPSASDVRDNTTCYAGITGSSEAPIDVSNNGVFILNRMISDNDIPDGLGYTMFVGEKLSPYIEDLGWISGTRSSLRNAGHPINAELKRVHGVQDPKDAVDALYVGGLASDHAGGAYVLMGSGEYEFRSSSMDLAILMQMADRADGGIPSLWQSSEPLADSAATEPPAKGTANPTTSADGEAAADSPATDAPDAATEPDTTDQPDAAADSSENDRSDDAVTEKVE